MGDSGSQLKTFVQWRLVEIENIKCAPAGDKIVTLFFLSNYFLSSLPMAFYCEILSALDRAKNAVTSISNNLDIRIQEDKKVFCLRAVGIRRRASYGGSRFL